MINFKLGQKGASAQSGAVYLTYSIDGDSPDHLAGAMTQELIKQYGPNTTLYIRSYVFTEDNGKHVLTIRVAE